MLTFHELLTFGKFLIMKEDFLYFLWETQAFDSELYLQELQKLQLQIVKKGFRNPNSGPDFLESGIKVADISWFGAVEMHVKSSDWYQHKHHIDEVYNQVILHVVWENDQQVRNEKGEELLTFEVKNVVKKETVERFQNLIYSPELPCRNYIENQKAIHIRFAMDKALTVRMEYKNAQLEKLYTDCGKDMQELVFRWFVKAWSRKINETGFDLLTQFLSVKILFKHSNSLHQLEALFFGVAGFLNYPDKNGDDYFLKLKKEFRFLKAKYKLDTVDLSVWKFSKTRWTNFPTVRLAQLAALFFKKGNMDELLHLEDSETFKHYLNAVQVSEYWKKHYHFGKEIEKKAGNTGKGMIDSLLINGLAPLAYFYSVQKQDPKWLDRMYSILESADFEDNRVTRIFPSEFYKLNAYDSQALYGLFTHYCSHKKCLDCAIGTSIIKSA